MAHTRTAKALAAGTALAACVAAAPGAQALTVTYEVAIDGLGDAGEPAVLTLDLDDAFVAGFAGRETTLEMGTATVSFAGGDQPISWPNVVIDCVQGPCPEADALTGFDLGEFVVPGEDRTLALGIELDALVDTPQELIDALMSVSVVVGSFDTSGDEPVFLETTFYEAEGVIAPLPPAAFLFAGGAAGLAALRKHVSAGGGSR